VACYRFPIIAASGVDGKHFLVLILVVFATVATTIVGVGVLCRTRTSCWGILTVASMWTHHLLLVSAGLGVLLELLALEVVATFTAVLATPEDKGIL
jgi:hypothetical protein